MATSAEAPAAPVKKTPTDKQIAANRANAQRSTGPRSAEGKAAVRRNAVKDGFTGDGVVLPADMEAEVQREMAIFAARLAPADDYEWRLVRQAAIGSVRFERLYHAQEANLALHRNRATRAWDEARAAEVQALASLLDDDPAHAVEQLQRLAEGCDFLSDSWDALKSRLDQADSLDDDDLDLALRLLGRSSRPEGTEDSDASFLTGGVLGSRADRAALAAFLDVDPESVDEAFPARAECREGLLSLIEQEMERLQELGDRLWDRYDGPDRAGASQRAWVDTSAEGQRLRRYDRDANRLMYQALRELDARRKQPAAPSRPAPAPTPTPASKPRPAGASNSGWKGSPGASGYAKMAEQAQAVE
jgi:hypothetical protein